MAKRGLLIDYEYCTGCHACEVACRQEHGYALDQWGIRVDQLGPLRITDDRWTFHFVPTPTELCNLCKQRTVKGVDPSCVVHCPTACISFAQDPAQVRDALDRVAGSQRVVFFNK